jgi:hypothetical protein
MKMDRTEIADKLYDIASEVEDLMNRVERDNTELDEPASSLDEWKTNVISNIPKGASMSFRMKVEEFLETVKGVD